MGPKVISLSLSFSLSPLTFHQGSLVARGSRKSEGRKKRRLGFDTRKLACVVYVGYDVYRLLRTGLSTGSSSHGFSNPWICLGPLSAPLSFLSRSSCLCLVRLFCVNFSFFPASRHCFAKDKRANESIRERKKQRRRSDDRASKEKDRTQGKFPIDKAAIKENTAFALSLSLNLAKRMGNDGRRPLSLLGKSPGSRKRRSATGGSRASSLIPPSG